MRAEQISVFLENKAGRLCEVTGILAEAQVNIRALALADTSDFGVLRLIVDDTEKAKEALKKAGLRDRVKTMVGGAVATDHWAKRIGADFFGETPADTIDKLQRILNQTD
jgi:hypothetical protein